MAKELEYKYLVASNSFLELAFAAHEITQGYLCRASGRSVRIRIIDSKAFITIKGTEIEGVGRDEYEYEIPITDGEAMLEMCQPPIIVKTRYIVPFDGETWEVDVFHNELSGLMLAELEVESYDHTFNLPSFVGKNVTNDPRYKNTNLRSYSALETAL